MEKLSIKVMKSLFEKLSVADQNTFRDFVYQPTEVNLECDAYALCRYIYESFVIDHFEYQGEKYYEIENLWGGEKGTQNNHFDHFVCDGYDKCNIMCQKCIEIKNTEDDEVVCQCFEHIPVQGDVKYVLKHVKNESLDDDDPMTDFYDFLDKNGRNIQVVRRKDKLCYDHITVFNPSGENVDHRGSTHCALQVDMEYEIELDLPCSLMKFAEVLFRLKSHKWDKWYEMYTDAVIEENTLHVSFDHGS